MRRKRIARKLSEATKEIIREMHSGGLTNNEISGYTGVSSWTINNLVVAWNKGFSDRTELEEHYAKEKGYGSHKDYNEMLHYSKNPDIFHSRGGKSLQQKFEEDLEERAERIDIPNEDSQSPNLEEALERLAQRHPREYRVLVKSFYEEKTQQEIGDEEGVTRQRIEQLEKEAIEHMRTYLGSNFKD